MAQVLQGSFTTTSYSNRNLVFSWTATQDIAKNQSTISWTLKGGGSQTQYMKSGNFKVVIAGETVYESATRIELYNGTLVASGTKVIKHNNDGSKSFTASAQAGIYNYAVNCSGSATWELKTIPRYASLLTAPNFTDEDNPTITYSNPAGQSVSKIEVAIYDNNGATSLAAYREIPTSGTSYTFTLTEAERAKLRAYSINSNTATVRFYIKSTASDNSTSLSNLQKTLTIINANPVINPSFVDMASSVVTAITGSATTMARYVSDVFYAVNATPQKGATIKEYSVTNGSTVLTTATGVFGDIANSVVKIVVTDSRNNTTTQEIDLANNSLGYAWVDYIFPTCSATATAELSGNIQTQSKININVSGNCFSGAIGATQNTLTIQYIIKERDSDNIVERGSREITTNNNKYNIVVSPTQPTNYSKAYVVTVGVKDALTADVVWADSVTVTTMPVFDWGKDDFNFNVPVKFNGVEMVDFIVEQGTEAMGTNGTWYWCKWNSGRAECYGLRNYGNMGVSTAFGGFYRSAAFQQSLPSGLFVSAPECCNINYAGSSSDWAAFIMPRLPADTSNSCGFYVMRPESGTISQAKISFHILGRWK